MRTKISDYRIEKVKNGYRVCLVSNPNKHTHLKSKSGAESAIDYVVNGKIPKRVGNYYLTSLQKLSLDQNYISKIQELIDVRIQKGKKQTHYNSRKKRYQ